MCGITGFKKLTKKELALEESLQVALDSLKQRGPDFQDTYLSDDIGLGHSRLSIIDTSSKAHQPMTDKSGRFMLIFNGEIYNFKELQSTLEVDLQSTSDTEVLLYLLIKEGEKCLPRLNGFFAFAFYDSKEGSLLIARDRMGIKPLHYYYGEDFFAFGSEMKALLKYPIPRAINQEALYWYLRLTYVPHELSIIKEVKKLLPGHFLKISKSGDLNVGSYWDMSTTHSFEGSYDKAKNEVIAHLEKSVENRMIADVPLGAFLSGGTDSSAVVSMASKFNPNLHTFSIGYKEHSFFDETHFAELVANKFKTNHTTFSLTNDDLLNSVDDVIDYIDEPFADSSAIPTYILSKHVSQSMKVTLSGDGADELFGGYYKHLAFFNSEKNLVSNHSIKHLKGLFANLPQSRSSFVGNTVRRLDKYSSLLNLNSSEKYWLLASFNQEANEFMANPLTQEETKRLMNNFTLINHLNDFLDADLQIVLPGDMLTKVDLMSMANSLEVRVPFLDPELIQFARSLPSHFKVQGNQRKRILQDAFEHILPKELHHRKKKGFEVPMLDWLRNELLSKLDRDLFDEEFLESQGLFNSGKVLDLRTKLLSKNPGDVHVIIWSLYVFQHWYRRYFE